MLGRSDIYIAIAIGILSTRADVVLLSGTSLSQERNVDGSVTKTQIVYISVFVKNQSSLVCLVWPLPFARNIQV